MTTALAGLVLVSSAGDGGHGDRPVLGITAALGSGAAYAFSAKVGAVMTQRHDAVAVAGVTMTVAGVVLVAVGLPVALAQGQTFTTPDLNSWLLIIYLGVVTMALAYVLLFAGLRTTPSGTAVIATLLEPVTAVAIAVLFLDEKLTVGQRAGITAHRRRHRQHRNERSNRPSRTDQETLGQQRGHGRGDRRRGEPAGGAAHVEFAPHHVRSQRWASARPRSRCRPARPAGARSRRIAQRSTLEQQVHHRRLRRIRDDPHARGPRPTRPRPPWRASSRAGISASRSGSRCSALAAAGHIRVQRPAEPPAPFPHLRDHVDRTGHAAAGQRADALVERDIDGVEQGGDLARAHVRIRPTPPTAGRRRDAWPRHGHGPSRAARSARPTTAAGHRCRVAAARSTARRLARRRSRDRPSRSVDPARRPDARSAGAAARRPVPRGSRGDKRGARAPCARRADRHAPAGLRPAPSSRSEGTPPPACRATQPRTARARRPRRRHRTGRPPRPARSWRAARTGRRCRRHR